MPAEYRTSDYGEAAFLMARGFPAKLVPIPGKGPAFTFPLNAERDGVEYYEGALIVARLYHAAMRDVRSMLARQPRPESSR